MIVKVRATLEWRGGGMSRTWIRGPSKWRQVSAAEQCIPRKTLG